MTTRFKAITALLCALFLFAIPASTADIKVAYGAEQTLTVTNLHSLASSATAGWQSGVIDNTSTLHTEAKVSIVLDFANTAPSASFGVYVYLYTGVGTDYTSPATGTEGTITLLDVTTTPNNFQQVGFIQYRTADEVVKKTIHIHNLPSKWGVVLMNHSGAALAASGNTVKWTGIHYTSN